MNVLFSQNLFLVSWKSNFRNVNADADVNADTELLMPIFPNVQWSTNINRTNNSWNRFGVEYSVLDVFMYFWMVALNSQQLKILQSGNPSHDIPRRKHFRPTKYPRGKFRAREITTKAQQHNDSRSAIPPMARD